jgi:porin
MNCLRCWYRATVVSCLFLIPFTIRGQESTPVQESTPDDSSIESGLLADSPLADPFAGKMTGKWFGARSALAESGVTFDWDVTQFYFGTTTGGLEREFRYGGLGDYVTLLDFGKMGLAKGLFLKLRAQNRFGETLAGATGALLSPTIAPDLPDPESNNVFLTNVLFTQFLSPRFGVFAGKLDTFDGDLNAFAHMRGKDQFSNIAFVSSPVALRTIPYVTVGTGFFILGKEQTPVFTFNVLNPVYTPGTSGLENLFGEGVTLASDLRLPTRIFGLPGHQLIGGTWSSRRYVGLDQDPRVILPSIPLARQNGSWSVYYNFDQFLHVDPTDPSKGWGLFGRAGLADDATNPIEWFLSAGVGGNSPLRGRGNDRFGVGWHLTGTSDKIDPLLARLVGGLRNGQGVELFYNFEVNPWFHITPDLQVIIPAREQVDTSLVIGIRAKIDF